MSEPEHDLLSIAVFVSGQGRGSNLGALIDACVCGQIAGKISVVVATRADAPALERAKSAGIATSVVSPRKYAGDEDGYARVLLRILRTHDVQLICLAGYSRMLPRPVVQAYPQRIMNVHPALLPLFGGRGMYIQHVHEAVLASGMKVSGCTVHFVDEEYDTGPIILQSTVPVLDSDTPDSLAARILPEEHRTYVRAVQLFAAGQLHVEGSRVLTSTNSKEAVL